MFFGCWLYTVHLLPKCIFEFCTSFRGNFPSEFSNRFFCIPSVGISRMVCNLKKHILRMSSTIETLCKVQLEVFLPLRETTKIDYLYQDVTLIRYSIPSWWLIATKPRINHADHGQNPPPTAVHNSTNTWLHKPYEAYISSAWSLGSHRYLIHPSTPTRTILAAL